MLLLLLFQSRSSMLMFTGGFLTLMAIGGFPSFVEEMKVLLLQFIFYYFQIVLILNKDSREIITRLSSIMRNRIITRSFVDATNRNLLNQLDHDMILKIRVMHRRSLNLARSVIHVPKLSRCTFRSTKLLIMSSKV